VVSVHLSIEAYARQGRGINPDKMDPRLRRRD